ncbi:acetyl-CoA C-acyltransferase family protein [Azospirillum sp.]|uniref:acetyl-CoA C-acyltransferase family protein n=1 Tax=Azospirillum sp. TaxID=34012 RepID=UPI002D390C49|nr:acetyl-CoA C-acyltransferase family protein [Azospirillum sp.]HYD69273.1 acetyl-CoA C-acyltransferase family protein [Azospirillum sp.]
MSGLQDVVIAGAVRTAVGDFGGALKDMAPADLGALVMTESLRRADVAPAEVQHVVVGQVIQTEPRDMYVSRVAAMRAGIPDVTPAMTLNRLCGSGLQAIVSASQMIRLGECDVAVAAGTECMSRAPYVSTGMRWGARLGDAQMVDALVGALTDPFGHGHMGITAENVAARYGLDRAAQDAFSAESHRRAVAAIAEGRFKEQIVPVELKTRKGVTLFDTDEHPRAGTTAESLGTLKPVFKKDGTVTAGNASSINDGAASVVLVSAREAERRGMKPMARVVAWGHAGVAPEVMGLGPVPAVPIALQRAGLTIADIDVIESNEAFAAQACAVSKELGFPAERTNPNGGAVALGHPVGATGVIITVKTLYELQRTGGRFGLMTMCIGGGQGIAVIVERL